jgi:hypothetical protein
VAGVAAAIVVLADNTGIRHGDVLGRPLRDQSTKRVLAVGMP